MATRPAPQGIDEVSRAEAYRILRSNLDASIADLDRPTVLVTSPNPGEGKTLTVANLAYTIAATGRRVVVVDLDLRHPDIHSFFGAHNEMGATDVLLARRPLSECLQFVETRTQLQRAASGLYVLPAGPPVDNPAELLSTNRASRLVDALDRESDVVLIDGPPVLPVADSLSLARVAGGVVMVAAARQTTYPELERAIERLTRNQARILGVVLNKAREAPSYGYGFTPNGDS